MSENKKERIQRKVKALLSKTIENGATPEEFTSAFEKAKKLMMAHGIEDSDIEDKPSCEPLIIHRKGSRVQDFHASSLAKYLNCTVLMGQRGALYVFGKMEAQSTFELLHNQILARAEEARIKYGNSDECYLKYTHMGFNKSSLMTAFYKGYLLGVAKVLKDQIEKETEYTDSDKLMLVGAVALQNEWTDREGMSVGQRSRKTRDVGGAGAHGVDSGKNYKMNKAMTVGKSRMIG